jgi:tripartite-type tricarboxylate transporter receptor subunit TctC
MRSGIIISAIIILVLGLSFPISSQGKYPEKPIELVVASGVWGTQDLFWNTIKENLEEHLRVPISVVNKSGTNGLLGADFVANSKNDGYTLLAAPTILKTAIPVFRPNTSLAVDVLALCFKIPIAMVVRSDSSLRSLKDVINYAKKHPGALTCATQGIQSMSYFNLKMICSSAGIEITHVPNPKASSAMADVLGGDVDFWLGSFAGVIPLAKKGKLRILGITLRQSLPEYPEWPIFAEQGFPEADFQVTAGLMGPKDLPAEVFQAWQGALKNVLGQTDIQALLKKLNMSLALEVDRDKIDKIIKHQYEMIKEMAAKESVKSK